MPFTVSEFFDVFRAYNSAAWPVIAVAWVVAVALFVRLVRGRPAANALRILSIAQWAWIGIVYHAGFFAAINPAAWLFAAMFVTQAVLLLWIHIARRPADESWRWDPQHALGAAAMAYALAYPMLSGVSAGQWSAVPLFLVPCPLVIFETGLLMTSKTRVRRALLIVPVAWSLIGGSAAIYFGVRHDLALFACAVALIVVAVRPARPSPVPANVARRDRPRSRRGPARPRRGHAAASR